MTPSRPRSAAISTTSPTAGNHPNWRSPARAYPHADRSSSASSSASRPTSKPAPAANSLSRGSICAATSAGEARNSAVAASPGTSRQTTSYSSSSTPAAAPSNA